MSVAKCDLKIDWATYAAAKYACEHWHYSQRMPVGKLLKLGIRENNNFIGVIIFGVGASPNLHKNLSLAHNEVCELVRIALRHHETPVSRMISISLKILKKKYPNIRIVATFADPTESHYGGIYQGANWIYTGTSNAQKEYYYNGKWRHVKVLYEAVYRGLDKRVIKNLPCRITIGKHRYLMPLDDAMREQILPLSKPYPKREKQAMAGTTGTAAG